MQKKADKFYDTLGIVGDYPDAKDYLKKYWLDQEEYIGHWQPIQARIFDPKVYFIQAGRIFLPEFKLMSFLGGGTFVKKRFFTVTSVYA